MQAYQEQAAQVFSASGDPNQYSGAPVRPAPRPHRSPWRSLIKGRLFEAGVSKTFQAADISNDGRIQRAELTVALLRLYDFLNSHLPTHLEPPTNEQVAELLMKYDHDGSGALEYPEYHALCKSLLFNPRRWRDSLLLKVTLAVVGRVIVFPWAGMRMRHGLTEKVGLKKAHRVPIPAFALVLELVARQLLPM